jgi:putative oxidoreductase
MTDARLIPNDAATGAVRQSGTKLEHSRAPLIALWVTQVALALMFLMTGGSKLAGVPAIVSMFDAIGVGQWLRYVTGVIEITSAIALLVPSAAIFGVMLLIPTMLGATITNMFIIHVSPVMPLLLLFGTTAVAWARRDQLRMILTSTLARPA